MGQFISQLTGVRFIAAFWVLLYHYQPAFATAGLLVPVVHEFLRIGSLGVDLFFALSGFILTYTYLEKLGPAFKARGAGRFLWLRLARIYPVHLVMLNVAGLAAIAVSLVGAGDARERDWLNPISYLKQLFLVQEWGSEPDRGWNFVAWSLSMEWFAYLFFPFIALVLWRLRDRFPAPALAVCAFISLTPLLYIGISRDNDPFLTLGWASSVRVLTEFVAGAFVYLVVRRLKQDGGGKPSRRVSRVALILSWSVPLAIVIISVVLGRIPALEYPGLPNEAPRLYVIIIPFLIVWIGALALTDRGPAAFLSHRRLVLGGFISYSLYMIHLVWFSLWRAGMSAIGIDGGPLYVIGLVGLLVMAVVFAYGMWRFVEEPAREWLRSKIGVRVEPAGEEQFIEHREADNPADHRDRGNDSDKPGGASGSEQVGN
jgi:peptidoglycan/LPS O-acetylase OafA/YrhL